MTELNQMEMALTDRCTNKEATDINFRSFEHSYAACRAMISSCPSGIILFNRHGVILEINQALVEIFGYRSEKDFHPADCEALKSIVSQWQESFDNGNPSANIVVRTDKQNLHLSVSKWGFPDGGAENSTCLQITDVTKLKCQAQVLEDQLEVRSNCISGLSHDIRSMLGVILGGCEMLSEFPNLAAVKVEQLLSMIQRNAINLRDLTDDLLTFSQLDASGLRVEPVLFSPSNLLKEIVGDYDSVLQRKCIETHVVVGPDVPDALRTDPLRVRQIIDNIFGNAVKYTNHGHIKVELYTQCVEGRPLLCIRIEDNGPGIEIDNQKKLFKPFTRLTFEESGHGFGLYLARQLAHILGGDVVLVKSELGKGSAFEISVTYQ